MKTKQIIKFISLMMATIILLLSFSVSVSALEDSATENGSYVENQDTDVSDQESYHEHKCAPFWLIIVLAIIYYPSVFFSTLFDSIIQIVNEFINDIALFFVNVWTSIFG